MYFTKTCVYVKNHIKCMSERKGRSVMTVVDVQMVKTREVVAYGENVPELVNVIISALSLSLRKQVSCHHWEISKLLVE